MVKSNYTPIDKIISSAKKGEMYILVDDENRENEGDFIISAEKVTPDDINFMMKYGRGLICCSLEEDRCDSLGLNLMVGKNQ